MTTRITAKIVNDPEEPTFENTIVSVDTEKGDEYYELFSRVSTVFFSMLSANTTATRWNELAQKMSPILTQHANDIILNEELFERIKYVYDHPNRELTPEEQMLLEKQYDGFVRSGALLDKEGKEKLRQLTRGSQFALLAIFTKPLEGKQGFHTTYHRREAIGRITRNRSLLPPTMTAKEDGVEGWVFSLDGPFYSPFMTYSSQRELREKMFMARNTVCTHDNENNVRDLPKRLINLRREVAQLLGYDCFADYVLKHRMASDVEHVYQLFNNLLEAYTPTAIEEVKEVEEIAKEDLGDQEMMPWDFGYYSHKLQMKKYNLDSEMLRPYFQLDKVIDGVFGLAGKLYGITFKENKDIPVYHPDVKAYEVYDKDGSYLAVFYADFLPSQGQTRRCLDDQNIKDSG